MSEPSQLTAPPNSLKGIWDRVQANLTIKMPAMQLPLPVMGYGRQYLSHIEAPPRVVCTPGRGSSGRPEPRRGSGIDESWKLWQRGATLEIYVWGPDETETEVLANHVVASIHDELAGYYAMIGEQWGESRDTKFGDEVVLGVRVDTVWSREFIPAQVPATMSIAGTITPPS